MYAAYSYISFIALMLLGWQQKGQPTSIKPALEKTKSKSTALLILLCYFHWP